MDRVRKDNRKKTLARDNVNSAETGYIFKVLGRVRHVW
jgi:hypothetical protein